MTTEELSGNSQTAASATGPERATTRDDIRAVTERVLKLRTAMVDSDDAGLNDLVADELSYGHSSGRVEGKSEFVTAFTTGKASFESIALSDETIVIADDIAIVRHTMIAVTNPSGQRGDVFHQGPIGMAKERRAVAAPRAAGSPLRSVTMSRECDELWIPLIHAAKTAP